MNRFKYALLAALALGVVSTWAKDLHFTEVPNFFEDNPGGKPLGACHGGATIDKAGNIYISTDTDRGIMVYSPRGKFLRAFGPTRIHGLELRNEKGKEYIYAARPREHEVVKLDLNGETLWTLKC